MGLASSGDLTLTAGQSLILLGATASGGNASLSGASIGNAGGLTVSGSLTAAAANSLDLGAATVVRDAAVSAANVTLAQTLVGGNLVAAATQNLTLISAATVRGAANLSAGNILSNQNTFGAGGRIDVNAGAFNNAAAASLVASADTSINAASIDNQGLIYGNNTTITSAGFFDNSNGRVFAVDRLSVTAGALVSNQNGVMAAGQDASLSVGNAASFNNTGGTILANRDLALNLGGGSFDPSGGRAGTLAAAGTLAITVATIANTGAWQPIANGLVLTLQNDFTNTGTVELAGDFRLSTPGNILNSGRIATGGSIMLAGNTVTNTSQLLANQNLALVAAAGDVVNRGAIAALGDATVSGRAFDNRNATTQADRNLTVNVSGTLDNRGGSLLAKGNASLSAASLDNDRTAPVDTGATLRGHNSTLLNDILLQAATPPTCADLGFGYACTAAMPKSASATSTPTT